MLRLERFKQTDYAIFGKLYKGKEFICYTLELPYRDNEPFKSSIPEGCYKVKKWFSYHHGNCLKIFDVPGRTDILIHSGNFSDDTKGCVLVGEDIVDINKDGKLDVSNSRKTLLKLLHSLDDEVECLVIKNSWA